jgi:AcrR family transcriptional regulator
MDAVAAEAGFSRQGLYRHFASKDDLFVAVAADMHRRAARAGAEALAAAHDAGASPADLIAALMSARLWHYLGYVHGTPHAAELMQESNRLCGAQMMESERLARDALIALIAQQAEAGRMTLGGGLSCEALADMLILIGRGAKTAMPMPDRAGFDALLRRLTGLVVAGAAAI